MLATNQRSRADSTSTRRIAGALDSIAPSRPSSAIENVLQILNHPLRFAFLHRVGHARRRQQRLGLFRNVVVHTDRQFGAAAVRLGRVGPGALDAALGLERIELALLQLQGTANAMPL